MGLQITYALRQSLHRILSVLVTFLPALVSLLLALIVFTLAGIAVAALLRKLLTAIRFDERLASRQSPNAPSLVADWSPSHSPTLLLSRTALWLCILVGIAVGISAFSAAYSANSEVAVFLLPYLTHLTGAVLLIFVGNLIARFLARSVLIGAVNAQLQYARFLSLGVKWLVLVLTAAMALDHLQIGGAVVELAFGILFGGIVLTLSLAIGLGSRDLVSRSIEKTMEKPFTPKPQETSPLTAVEGEPRPRLRHF